MINCAKALNAIGEKVLFVSANSERHSLIHQDSIQHQKLKLIFEDDENVELIGYNLQETQNVGHGTPTEFEGLIGSKYKDYNIFIDEVHGFDEDNPNYKESIYKTFIRWDEVVDPEKHLWIVRYSIHVLLMNSKITAH